MSTITVILEADDDGTVHLPVPAEMRHGKIQITATLTAVEGPFSQAPRVSPEKLAQRRAALAQLRALGGLKESIPDPEAWQRENRQDRPLPGRD
jgi:hypothetical protein